MTLAGSVARVNNSGGTLSLLRLGPFHTDAHGAVPAGAVPLPANATVIRGQLKPEPQGWYSPYYDSYTPSQVLSTVIATPGDMLLAWIIALSPADDCALRQKAD